MARYTAEEMREASLWFYYPPNSTGKAKCFDRIEISAMLRHAADMMEREEMYECKGMVMKNGVAIWCSATYDNVTDARDDTEQYGPNGKVVVYRRTVGEWEEVK